MGHSTFYHWTVVWGPVGPHWAPNPNSNWALTILTSNSDSASQYEYCCMGHSTIHRGVGFGALWAPRALNPNPTGGHTYSDLTLGKMYSCARFQVSISNTVANNRLLVLGFGAPWAPTPVSMEGPHAKLIDTLEVYLYSDRKSVV